MKTSTTTGLIALTMQNPALEFEDFDQVVKQYRTRVLRFLLASLGDLDLAESLTQDCFWNAYRSRRTFRGDCSVHTWLTRIAVNLVRNHVRTRRFQFWKKVQRVDCEQIHHWVDRSISPEERASVNRFKLSGKPPESSRNDSVLSSFFDLSRIWTLMKSRSVQD
jgi:DNA-directed RNA polymerase specialized sigma24 family protein